MTCVCNKCGWSAAAIALIWFVWVVFLGMSYEYKVGLAAIASISPQAVQPAVKKPVVHSSVAEKKHRFFQLMRPLVVAENARVMQQRAFLQMMHNKVERTQEEQARFDALLRTYRIQRDAQGNIPWDVVWRRVDVVPVALVLAQAANESAWGTSRFAREGNNYFGQWCFQAGCGLVPLHRKEGATHEVKVFASPQLSVRSYLWHLNTGSAYKALRAIRAQQRADGVQPDAESLAEGLILYSERGQAYVESIQKAIRHNRDLM